jgi:hypothetical protein
MIMAASQLELIFNQMTLLSPDDLVKLIKAAAVVLEQKYELMSAASDAEGIDLQALGVDQAQAAELRASLSGDMKGAVVDWSEREQ